MKGIPIVIALLVSTSVLLSADNNEFILENSGLIPENTVILSNETDKAFCKDFSMLLKGLSLEWIVLEPEIPAHVKDKNVIILGGPDAEYTGDLVKQVLTWREERYLRKNGQYSIFEKESPFSDDRTAYVCAGSDRLLTKRAAEACITRIMKEAKDPTQWVNPFSDWFPLEAKEYMVQFMWVPDDEELPKDHLVADVHAGPPESISAQEAAEDVEYLFYLLSHGYSGYGYFKMEGDFDQAKESILKEVESQDLWFPRSLSEVIYEHLAFIHDGHFYIGYNYYFTHQYFWHATVELQKTKGEYSFTSDDTWVIMTVNGQPPEAFVFPSLNAHGEPVYILGMLSESSPGPFAIRARNEDGTEESFEMQLYYAAFNSKDIFSERNTGVPVVSIRSFLDAHSDELEQFCETASKYRGEPYLILDIRGNKGGNSTWPEKWVTKFTGHPPEEYFVSAAFISKTTMMGAANMFRQQLELNPEIEMYASAIDLAEGEATIFESMGVPPTWTASPVPYIQLIPNSTTLLVITDRGVASAGEVFLGYLRQVENVIFVGENTAGAATFGGTTLHQLPNSRLPVELPYRLFFPVDFEFAEGKGFFPDLWVPAQDALTYTLEAVENGTFVLPEDTDTEPTAGLPCIVVVITIFLYTFFSRKR